MRRRIYLAGPIVKGDLGRNIDQATDALHALMEYGLAPLCPHLSCFSSPVLRTWQGKPYVVAEVLGIRKTLLEVTDGVAKLKSQKPVGFALPCPRRSEL